MDERRPFIATYIEASRPFGVIYTGITSNLYKRGDEHRSGTIDGFSKRRGCGMLVWYEPFERVTTAIKREKAIKSWKRAWKMQLIEQRNPDWVDLYPWICGKAPDPRTEAEGEGGVAAFLAKLAQMTHP